MTVQNGQLHRGARPFRVKGVNYAAGRYVPAPPGHQGYVQGACPVTSNQCEYYFHFQMWHEFNEIAIDEEVRNLRRWFGVNTLRLMTPDPKLLDPFVLHGWRPWTEANGTIDPQYLSAIRAMLEIARRSDMKVQLVLLVGMDPTDVLQRPDFYRTYVDSVTPPDVVGHPALLAWEVGNEMLGRGKEAWLPGSAPSESDHQALKAARALILRMRERDANHLITSGELAIPGLHAATWMYPTPELTSMDVGGDGSSPSFSLESLVDFLSPHFYDFQVPADMLATLHAIRTATPKPVAIGEFGWRDAGNRLATSKEPLQAPQAGYFQMIANAVRTEKAGGLMVWSPMPLFDLWAGDYARWDYTPQYEGEPALLQLSQAGRWIKDYDDQFEFLYHDANSGPLKRMPAGELFWRHWTTPFDFSADGLADPAVYNDATWTWQVHGSCPVQFGQAGDIAVPADYDGDRRTDPAIARPDAVHVLHWFVREGQQDVVYGIDTDTPVPADYDGDGKADIAVVRKALQNRKQRLFWYRQGFPTIVWGNDGDRPVPADYDGNGTADLAFFRPSDGTWNVYGGTPLPYGVASDRPVPADYDGDGRADLAVVRSVEGVWHWFVNSTLYGPYQAQGVAWGAAAVDIPVPADYDGDGRADVAVYRTSDQNWYVWLVSGGTLTIPHGGAGDRPVQGVQ